MKNRAFSLIERVIMFFRKLAPAAIFFLLFSIPDIYAAPTYGTDMPEKGGMHMGYESNIVFKHDLNESYGNIKSDQHFFSLSYGIFEWLTVEGKAGMGDLLQKGGIHPKVYYTYGFAGGYGFRILALDDARNKVKVVAGFHHISVHPNNRTINGDKYESLLDDWQCSIVVSKRLGRLNPFLGGKISRCDLVYKVNEIDRKRRPPQHYIGVVMGCDLKLVDNIYARAEGRLIDESALSTSVYYKF